METVLEELKELGRQTAASNREFVRKLNLKGQVEEKRSALRQSLLTASSNATALFKLTQIWSRKMTPAEAVATWKKAREQFAEIEKHPMTALKTGQPDLDAMLDLYAELLHELLTLADAEYRAYAETAHLLRSPANAKRLEQAAKDTSEGKVTRWNSVAELIKSKRG